MAERPRIEDITTLAVGQIILVNGDDHSSTRMTVKAPYGWHEVRFGDDTQGVLCTALQRGDRAPYDVILTKEMADDSVIFLWENT